MKLQDNLETRAKFEVPNLRWWIFIFFIFVMIINYIDRASLSIAMPLISKDLNINPITTGLILSSFGWTYALMQLPGGWLVDRLKPRKIVSMSLVGWGIIQGLTGFVNSVGSLIGMRMVLGLFEGPVQNGANTSLINWLRKDEHSRGSTLVDGGGPLGTAFGGILVTGLIVWLGTWRLAFAAVGILTVLIGFIAWWFVRDRPSEHPWISREEIDYLNQDQSTAQEEETSKGSVLQYFKHLSPWMLLLAFFGYDAVLFGLMTWAPTYVSEVQHVSFGMTGVWTFVIFGSGFVGELFAGQLADRLMRSGISANSVMRTMLGFAGLGVAGAILCVSQVSSSTQAILLISLANFFLRWGGLYWSVPARLALKKHVGQLTGAMNFSGNIAGILAPILVGLIVQETASFSGVFTMFAIAGGIMALGSVTINYSRKLTS
ncbi:MFS transporter [Sporolactobacillus nakayamae]|uniref:MFS transporter, ACS family, D-galactonate transporter n=1 Tax=Sporolactobacillus nakayamae TaxID=269670 RepID=A0A1I2UDH0_9BACL|nr:MFS transporter [Sporolactobacillus nakayamae]SFG75192.1 MFS transporter, ACS family, D-galactonate transporter [Sporolactobacillus nakayamae]